MAREQRKDVDYFPHDCTHGRKMHIIETKYGNDGYATWFKLLEQLGKANNHYIDISDEMTLMFLSSVFKIDEEKTMQILTDLAKLEAIDKLLFDKYKVIWSEKFTEGIQDAYRKRKIKCYQYSDVLNEIMLKNDQSGGSLTLKGTNQAEVIPKVKESKVKESKENFNEEKFQDFQILFYKNLSDDFDFTFEIQKLRNQLDEENIDSKKIYLSQCLNFLIEQKRKKVPPKKENKHLEFIEELSSSNEWLSVVSIQNNNIEFNVIVSKLNEFKDHLFTSQLVYENKSDFLYHFKNWLLKKIPEKKTQQSFVKN